jgi:hypothetical protein
MSNNYFVEGRLNHVVFDGSIRDVIYCGYDFKKCDFSTIENTVITYDYELIVFGGIPHKKNRRIARLKIPYDAGRIFDNTYSTTFRCIVSFIYFAKMFLNSKENSDFMRVMSDFVKTDFCKQIHEHDDAIITVTMEIEKYLIKKLIVCDAEEQVIKISL